MRQPFRTKNPRVYPLGCDGVEIIGQQDEYNAADYEEPQTACRHTSNHHQRKPSAHEQDGLPKVRLKQQEKTHKASGDAGQDKNG